jgi:hypothetical protein
VNPSDTTLKRRIVIWLLATALVTAAIIFYQAEFSASATEGESASAPSAECEQAPAGESVPGCPPPGEALDK